MREVWAVLLVLGWSAALPAGGTAPLPGRDSRCVRGCRDSFRLVTVPTQSLSSSCQTGCQAYNISVDLPVPRCIKLCFDEFNSEEERLACQGGCTEASYLRSKPAEALRGRPSRHRPSTESVISRDTEHQQRSQKAERWPWRSKLGLYSNEEGSRETPLAEWEAAEEDLPERDGEDEDGDEDYAVQRAGGRPPPVPAGGIDFLECVSRHTGLPRWLVGLAVTAALLVIIWLTASCLLAITPAVEPRLAMSLPTDLARSEVTWTDLTVPGVTNESKASLLTSQEELKTPL